MILQRVNHNAARAGGAPVDDVMHGDIRRQAGGRAKAVRELDRVLAGVCLGGRLECQSVAGGAVDRFAVEVPLVVEWIALAAHGQPQPRAACDYLILRLRRHLRQYNLVVCDRLLPLEHRIGDNAERLAKRNNRLAWLPRVGCVGVGNV